MSVIVITITLPAGVVKPAGAGGKYKSIDFARAFWYDAVAKYYERTVIFTNSLITLIAVGLTFLCRLIWTKPLEALGLGHANVLFMIGAAVIYFIIITFVNVIIIRSHLLRIWHNR